MVARSINEFESKIYMQKKEQKPPLTNMRMDLLFSKAC